MRARMWVQIGGAGFFACIAIAEVTNLKSPTFSIQMGWIIFALAAAAMVFEAWRMWRKMKIETNEN